jgi:hypothetical protein
VAIFTDKSPVKGFRESDPKEIAKEAAAVLTPENYTIDVKTLWEDDQLGTFN